MAPTTRSDSKMSEAIKVWLSPILIGVVGYFAKLEFQEIKSNQAELMRAVPVLQTELKSLRKDIDRHEGLLREHDVQIAQKSFFIKPEDIKLPSQQ